MSLFSELSRRNVVKVSIAYVAVAWIIIQTADVLAPQLSLPEWTPRMITFIVLLGFPVSLVMAWALELTPQGVRKSGGSNMPVYGLAVVLAAISVYWYFGGAVDSVTEPRGEIAIAVIPFRNVSLDEANDPFTIGLHDDLISQLLRIRSLRTIPVTSVLRYRDTDMRISEIADELDVTAAVEGSVQKIGDIVRINVTLIDAASEEPLWNDSYNGELSATDYFEFQSNTASEIANALQATLTQDDERRLSAIPTTNLEALEAYFTGKQLVDQATGEAIESAIQQYDLAIRLDPNFALAHAGLGYAWLIMPWYSATVEPDVSRVSSQTAIAEALRLEPELPSGLAFLGWSKMVHDYDWASAVQLLNRALELQPNNGDVLHRLSHVMSWQGNHAEAIAFAQQAAEIDPYSPLMKMNLAYILMDDGRFAEAAIYRDQTLELRPNYTELWQNTWMTFLRAGEFDNATEALVNWAAGTGRDVDKARQLGGILEQSQSTGEIAQFPENLLKDLTIGQENLAQVYAAGGDTNSTISELRIALDKRAGSRSVLSMRINPLYDFIRDDSRFIEMLRDSNQYSGGAAATL